MRENEDQPRAVSERMQEIMARYYATQIAPTHRPTKAQKRRANDADRAQREQYAKKD